MANTKVFTPQSHPHHKAVKAAVKKGLENFTITWEHALSRNRGWRINSRHFYARGYDLQNLIDKINNSTNDQMERK